MAAATVTSAIDHSLFCVLGNLKLSGFIFIKRPKVVLLVKVCLTSFCFVFFELLVTDSQKLSVFLCGHGCIQISAARYIP